MEERIKYLFRRFASRELSRDEARELKNFIEESETNRRLFQNFVMLRKTELQADMHKSIDVNEAWRSIKGRINRNGRRRWIVRTAVAASIMLIAGLGGYIYNIRTAGIAPELEAMMNAQARNRATVIMPNVSGIQLDGSEKVRYMDSGGNILCENSNGNLTYHSYRPTPQYDTVEVEEGSTYKITLADGSTMTLSSGSELVYSVGGDSRDVKLKGEAFFDVTHDEDRPFTVDCGNDVRVTVMGTKFNVVARESAPVVVTLESGSVAVATSVCNSVLSPNEQATVGADGNISMATVDAGQYTQWAFGIYEFDNAPLSDIVTKLSLWYGIDFKFASEHLRHRKFTGVLLRNKNLNYSLDLLKNVSNLNFRADGESMIIE